MSEVFLIFTTLEFSTEEILLVDFLSAQMTSLVVLYIEM